MSRQITRKNKVMIVIGVFSIIFLLSYTWVHTGNLLANYVNPTFIGFFAAAGIELSIVGLSMRIGEQRKSGLNYKFFGFTLIAVVIVSALANIAEGFLVRYGEPLTISNVGKLDIVQATVLIAATGLISLVTLALSELIGQDVTDVQKASQRKSDKEDGGYAVVANNPEIPASTPLKLTAPKTGGTMTDEEFAESMAALGADAPNSIAEVEKKFGLSHPTASRRLKKYRETILEIK